MGTKEQEGTRGSPQLAATHSQGTAPGLLQGGTGHPELPRRLQRSCPVTRWVPLCSDKVSAWECSSREWEIGPGQLLLAKCPLGPRSGLPIQEPGMSWTGPACFLLIPMPI